MDSLVIFKFLRYTNNMFARCYVLIIYTQREVRECYLCNILIIYGYSRGFIWDDLQCHQIILICHLCQRSFISFKQIWYYVLFIRCFLERDSLVFSVIKMSGSLANMNSDSLASTGKLLLYIKNNKSQYGTLRLIPGLYEKHSLWCSQWMFFI